MRVYEQESSCGVLIRCQCDRVYCVLGVHRNEKLQWLVHACREAAIYLVYTRNESPVLKNGAVAAARAVSEAR